MNYIILEKEFFKILNQVFITKTDIYYFLKFLLNKNYFFEMIEKNEINKLKNIWKNIFLKEMDNNEVVFYEGDISTNFYIILKGNTGIYKRSINEDLKKIKIVNKEKYKKIIEKNYTLDFYKKLKKNKILYNKIYENFNLIKVASVSEGGNFGELAIINNQKRKATVITSLGTDFNIKIYKEYIDDYDFEEFKNLYSKKFKNKVLFGFWTKDFFKKNMEHEFIKEKNNKLSKFKWIFNELIMDENLINILPYFNKVEYNPRNIICKKGEKFNKVLLINEGNVELIDNIKVNKLYKEENNENSKSRVNNIKKNENFISYLKLKIKKKLFLNNVKFETKVRYLKNNDFIGLYEWSNNLDNFFFSAKAVSKVTLYEISLENINFLSNSNFLFREILLKFLINFDEYSKRKNQLKIQWQKNINSINYNSVPILKTKVNLNKKEKIKKIFNKKYKKINDYLTSLNSIKNREFKKFINLKDQNIISNMKFTKRNNNIKKYDNLRSKYIKIRSNIHSKANSLFNSINSNIIIKKKKKDLKIQLRSKYLKSLDIKSNQILGIKNVFINNK